MGKTLQVAVGATAAVAAMFLTMDYALSVPNVQVDYASNECVAVENFPGVVFGKNDAYTCENLPSKFNQVWVLK